MHVTRVQWCDFVVWSPKDDTFVQRVYYNKSFMENATVKARPFYFKKYFTINCFLHDHNTECFRSYHSQASIYCSSYSQASTHFSYSQANVFRSSYIQAKEFPLLICPYNVCQWKVIICFH